MVAFGFKEQFHEKVINGEKVLTIRPFSERKRQMLINHDNIELYAGWRTPDVRLLGRSIKKDLFFLCFEVDLWNDEAHPSAWITNEYYDDMELPGFRLIVDRNIEAKEPLTEEFAFLDIATMLGLIVKDGQTPEEFIKFFNLQYNLLEQAFIVTEWEYPLISPDRSLLDFVKPLAVK